MTTPYTTRRALIAALVPLLATGNAGAQSTQGQAASSRILVVYFSRSGNTRVIAGTIARALRTTLAEIIPVRAYPEDYEATVARATRERRADFRPPLAPLSADPAGCQTLFLGFPVWGTTAPAVIRSFLSTHDLSGRTLVPFITHGGYGIGSSLEVLASHAPRMRHLPPFVLECDQERRTLNLVNQWLGKLPVAKPSAVAPGD